MVLRTQAGCIMNTFIQCMNIFIKEYIQTSNHSFQPTQRVSEITEEG